MVMTRTNHHLTDTILTMGMTRTNHHPTDTILTMVMIRTNHHLTDTILTMGMTRTNHHPTDTILTMVMIRTNHHPTDTILTMATTRTRSHTMTMKNLITRNQNLPRNHTNKNMNQILIRPLTIITKNLSMDMGRTIPINHPKIITGTITTTNRITRNMAEVITTTKNHTVATECIPHTLATE